MNTDRTTTRDWLGTQNEVQFFIHSSSAEPLSVIGVKNTSQCTIQVRAKPLRDIKPSPPSTFKACFLDSVTGRCQELDTKVGHLMKLLPQLWMLRVPDYKCYSYGFEVCSDSNKEVVGRASVLPQHLRNLEGTLTLTLHDADLLPVGTISVDYIVVLPCDSLADWKINDQWRVSKLHQWVGHSMIIGHRGNGMTFCLNQPTDTIENTIASFEKATELGAIGVEFDVQLTKDLEPVIYHDLMISLNVAPDHYFDVLLKDLTYDQIKSFKLSSKDKSRSPLSSSGVELGGHSKNKVFPHLREVLKELPESVFFNVEVKYPLPKTDGEECDYFPYVNRNTIADVIISTLYQYGSKRNMVMSTFDPSLCTMLQLKQPQIPVFFLTENKSLKYPLAVDIRNHSACDAVAFSKSQNFAGISVCVDRVNNLSEVINLIHNHGLFVMTWGENNSVEESESWQNSQKVTAIMCDRIPTQITK
ncbi:glycerophosphocholine phosphodiesterase GPCPD1-like isoform X1 [Dysidea avara]|uniref:glycerophosphocholine phosphodiesterase GPCPD1-like isoform X1 n=1 Tax=Dysidea avara TaxID=196820 RepID=UPI00332EC427